MIEILITTVIASIISLALFSAFSNGIKIWRRVNTRIAAEEFALFCERLHDDLACSFNFTAIAFTGSEKKVEFPSLVTAAGRPIQGIGSVAYSFDDGVLRRAASDYPGVFAFRRPEGRAVLTGLEECSFEYYFFDRAKKEYRWLEQWSQAGLPLAVRLTCEFKDGNKAMRTFTIPVGGQGL